MKVNTDDVLRDYRIKALTSPLSAYEMTNLDREMGDILSRTDLATDRKLKLFYDTLNKFQVTRKNYIHQTSVPQQKPTQQLQPNIKQQDSNNSTVKNETVKADSMGEDSIEDVFNSILGNAEEERSPLRASTPTTTGAVSSKLFPDVFAVGDTPKKHAEKEVLTALGNTKLLTDDITNEFNSSNDGVIYLADGSKKRAIGNISDITPIVERLTNPTKTPRPRTKYNKELESSVTELINSKYLSRLTPQSKKTVTDLYPNLQTSSRSSSVPSRRSVGVTRSPINLRSGAVSKSQKGKGRVLKIFFNKWNQLLV